MKAKMCFKLNYKVLGTDLFILCSHSIPNTSFIKLTFKRQKINLPEVEVEFDICQALVSEQLMVKEFYAKITTWLEEQFRLIKNEPDYISVQRVVFASDVNLGQPGDAYYPDFLLNDYIQNQFAPNEVEKILFSSCSKVVATAIERSIKDAEIINAGQLLGKVRDRFKDFLITPVAQQLSNIKDCKKEEKDAQVATANLDKPTRAIYVEAVTSKSLEDPKATGPMDNSLPKVKEDKMELPVITTQNVTSQVNNLPIENQGTVNLPISLFNKRKREELDNEQSGNIERLKSSLVL